MEFETYNLTFKDRCVALLVFGLIVSQGMSSPYFYINWLLGGGLITYSLLRNLVSHKIDKRFVFTILLSTLWIWIPVISILGIKIVNLMEHLKYVSLYIFYIYVATVIVKHMFELSKEKLKAIILFVNEIWLSVSVISYLFFIFLNDLYGNSNFSSIMENRNIFAMTTTIVISYVIFFKNSYTNKIKVNILIVTSFILILASFSVKGFAGWIMIYVLSNFYNSDLSISTKRRNKLVVVLMLFTVLVGLVVTDNRIIYRIDRFIMVFTSPEELRVGESAYLRSFFINESIDVIKQNPLDGIGVRNSKYYLVPPNYKAKGLDVGTYSHNNYIEIMLSGGIYTFLLYYIPILIAMYILRKKRRYSNLANYLFLLGLYKFFIDFGSVNYDVLIMNIVLVLIVYGQFMLPVNKSD